MCHKLFFWLLRGLGMSDEPRMGWNDSSMVIGGSYFKEDIKVDIKRDYRGFIREYFEESILLALDKSEKDLGWVGMTQV